MTGLARRDLIFGGANLLWAASAAASVTARMTGKPIEDLYGTTMSDDARSLPDPSHSILDLIGNTSMLRLNKIVPKGLASIFLKLESENPTGSMKGRMAFAMIEAAEKKEQLKPGGRVVEYTGGSTGVSLALVSRVRGYSLDLVTSDAFSLEKRNHMAALGAKLTVVKSNHGGMDESLTRNMIEAARLIQERSGAYWTDQLNNESVLDRYRGMGEEIWRQTEGEVDAFVQGVGTGGSLRGVAEQLLDHNPDAHIVAVEPSESAVLSGEEQASHKIEGIGAGFVVPLWRPEIVDEIAKVSTEDAQLMARHLTKEEGVFAGTSTGANLFAALKVAKKLGPGKTVVAMMVDSGMKYLSTELYKSSSLESEFFLA